MRHGHFTALYTPIKTRVSGQPSIKSALDSYEADFRKNAKAAEIKICDSPATNRNADIGDFKKTSNFIHGPVGSLNTFAQQKAQALEHEETEFGILLHAISQLAALEANQCRILLAVGR